MSFLLIVGPLVALTLIATDDERRNKGRHNEGKGNAMKVDRDMVVVSSLFMGWIFVMAVSLAHLML